jgi:hypothetical protein
MLLELLKKLGLSSTQTNIDSGSEVNNSFDDDGFKKDIITTLSNSTALMQQQLNNQAYESSQNRALLGELVKNIAGKQALNNNTATSNVSTGTTSTDTTSNVSTGTNTANTPNVSTGTTSNVSTGTTSNVSTGTTSNTLSDLFKQLFGIQSDYSASVAKPAVSSSNTNTTPVKVDTTTSTTSNSSNYTPSIKKIKITNPKFYSYGTRTKDNIKSVIWHRTDGGTIQSSIDWGAKKGYGAHYYIGRDGSIIQTGNETDVLKHAGKVNNPIASNRYAIGVEIAGRFNKKTKSWENLTSQQKQAITYLAKHFNKNFGITGDRMFYHSQVSKKAPNEGYYALQVAKKAIGV